jgi:serine protease Do
MRRCALALVLPLLLAVLTQSPGRGAAPPPKSPPPPVMPKNLKELRALEAKIQQTLKKILPATVGVGNGGSGVVVSKDGLIVSVAHVTQKAEREVTITFSDGTRAKAKTLGNFRGADASLLKMVENGPWPFVEMAQGSDVRAGQWCLAVGYPVSFTRGQKPPVRIGRVLRQTATAVTSDCPIMGGDSGGPLFDLEGRVIGVNSRVSGSIIGNVHVAIDVYHNNWKRLLAGEDWGGSGRQRGTSLDTSMPILDLTSLSLAQAPRQGNREPGALERNTDSIRSAFRDAVEPMSKSTVRVLLDDKPAMLGTIVSADGLIVTKSTGLKGKITCKLPGGKVVEAKKVGEDKEFDLALLEVESKDLVPVKWHKSEPEQGYLVACASEDGKAMAIGLITSEPRQFKVNSRNNPNSMPDAKRGYLGVSVESSKEGVRIGSLRPGAPAEKSGLKRDDIITKVGTVAVKTNENLTEAMRKYKPDEKVDVVVKRGEKEETLSVTLGKPPAELNREPYDRWGGGPFSERRFGYPKVLPHDSVLKPTDCGGLLVDTSGRAVGLNISRSLRISTYTLLPADIEKVVKKLSEERDKTKPKE